MPGPPLFAVVNLSNNFKYKLGVRQLSWAGTQRDGSGSASIPWTSSGNLTLSVRESQWQTQRSQQQDEESLVVGCDFQLDTVWSLQG